MYVELKRCNSGLCTFELNCHLLVIPLLQVCFAIVTIGNGLEYCTLLTLWSWGMMDDVMN